MQLIFIASTKQLNNLQQFIEIFGDQTLRQQVTGILQNLSISFLEKFIPASSQNITSNFLVKALEHKRNAGKDGLPLKSEALSRRTKCPGNLFDEPISEHLCLYSFTRSRQKGR